MFTIQMLFIYIYHKTMEEENEELQIAPEDISDMMEEYDIITFPNVQFYMEEEWFRKEALLLNSQEQLDLYGSSAYLIPVERIWL